MADWYEKSRHDISITDPSTADVLGFVLARKNGVPIWQEYDGKYLADQFFTDAATQANLDPEKELLLGQSDWRSGFGLSIYDPNDPKRYESSYGADLRFKDKATLSYGATSITPTAYAALTITNADMELTTGWTGGARDNTHAHAGTYGWLVSGASATQSMTWNNKYRNCYFKLQCYVWDNAASNSRLQIYDGVGTTNGSFHTGGGAFELLTVERYLDAAATELTIQFDIAATNAWFDDVSWSIEPLTGTMPRGIDFNDQHYVAHGNMLLKLNGTGDGFTTVRSFPATITDLAVFGVSGTDYLFVALGLSTAYQYMTAAEAFTVSNAAASYYQFFQPVYTTALTLYGNDTNSTIRSTTNPLNGGVAWSAATQVDSDLYDITGLRTQSGALYIAKEDKPFYLSAAGAVQNDLAPECESAIATTSGKNSDMWLGNWYYPYGSQYLLEIGTTNTRRSPSEYCTKQSDFAGKVAAVTHDGDQWLIVCLNNTTKVEVLMCREEIVDSETKWVVHPYEELTMGNCNNAWVSSVYQRRAWIASATSGESIQYIPLPTGYGDLTSDANRSFATGGYFTTPFLHGNFKETTKGLISVTATLGHAYDANIYWQVAYKKLGDTSWTNFVTTPNLVGTATSRTHTLYRTTSTTSPMFQLKFTGVTNTTNTTPELLSYTIKTIMYPTIRKLIFCTVRVGDGVTDKKGLSMSNKTVLQKTCLNNARNASWLVTMTDIDGTSTTCKFLPLPSGTPRRVAVKDEKGRTIEWEYNLILMEVATS